MTDKEKAAEEFQKTVKAGDDDHTWAFLAGCTYQEQVDREVIEFMFEALWSTKKILISEFGNRVYEVNFKHINEAINLCMKATDKATGQAEKE